MERLGITDEESLQKFSESTHRQEQVTGLCLGVSGYRAGRGDIWSYNRMLLKTPGPQKAGWKGSLGSLWAPVFGSVSVLYSMSKVDSQMRLFSFSLI